MPKKIETKIKQEKIKNLVSRRGRIFKGIIIKKFPSRVVIELERTIYIPKYERYQKKKTKLHAKITNNINVEVGDMVRIQETRPLSKIIHFMVIENLSNTKGEKI